ncbi:MAG: hypothetical protein AB7N76_07375 [Planctomycetota bacterium]
MEPATASPPAPTPPGPLRALAVGARALIACRWAFLRALLALFVLVGAGFAGLVLATRQLGLSLEAAVTGGMALWVLAVAWLLSGLIRMCADAVEGRAQARALFGEGRRLVRATVTWGLVVAACTVFYLPVALAFRTVPLGLLPLVQGLEVASWVAWVWVLQLVVTRDLGPLAALSAGWEIARGARLRLLGYLGLILLFDALLFGAAIALILTTGLRLGAWLLLALGVVLQAPLFGIGLAWLSREHSACATGATDRPDRATYAGAPLPWWGEPLALLALLPVISLGGSNAGNALALLRRLLWQVPQLNPAFLIAWAVVSALAGVVLLLWLHGRGRTVAVDDDGLLLDVGPEWSGTRVPWARVTGFQVAEAGVLVRVRRRLASVRVPAREREAHDLVARLEALGIPRVD